MNDLLARYKLRRRATERDPLAGFEVLGYIAAGTYGRVYKARERVGAREPAEGRFVAIKKFKAEKEGERVQHYVGLSQSAYRELALCRELQHENIVGLVSTILHDKSIYLVFDYAEHDLLQLIQFHCSSSAPSKRLAPTTIKSILYQVLRGVQYLHANWVLHRDLKPANIMITAGGTVKIGDLGLARIFREPLQSLYAGDKVVVTIWYRAPELLFGSRHYTPAIDTWAIGCIFAEMLSLRPIFKGEEATATFQRDQVEKVTKILGTPTPQQWPSLTAMPEYRYLSELRRQDWCLDEWHRHFDPGNSESFALLERFFAYDPDRRVSAASALTESYFSSGVPLSPTNCFEGLQTQYPPRRIASTDLNMNAPPKQKKRPATSQGTSSHQKRTATTKLRP